MKQINEKQLFFEKGEITGEKCIDSMCNMVDTYTQAKKNSTTLNSVCTIISRS